MSRYHSPYATRRRASRWPWVFAILIVVVASATGALAVTGESPDRLLRLAGIARDSTPTTAAVADQAAPGATATTKGGAAAAPTTPPRTLAEAPAGGEGEAPREAAGIQAAASDDGGDDGGASTAQAEAPTAPTAPTATPTTELRLPGDVVQAYAARWSAGDYAGLYDLLTTEAQGTITRQDFVDRYAAIAAEAGLTAVKVTVTGEPNLQTEVPIKVELESRLVGTITEENVVPLRKEGSDWKVVWTPSLIFKELGDGCVDYIAEPTRRGTIFDRDGDPLAADGTVNQVGVIPGQIKDEAGMLRALSKLIGMPQKEIKEKYQEGQPDWFMPIKQIPQDDEQRILNGISSLEGVAVRTSTARLYPLGERAAHITGYVTRVNADDLAADESGVLTEDDWIGRSGIEAAADELLRGKPGGRLLIVECTTRETRTEIAQRKPVPAQDLYLTIDREFQSEVYKALGNVQGAAVVLDPRTGAVLAMASRPSFDPNWFVLGFSDKDWDYVNDEKKRPLLNRATEAAYPTGSIFKVITAAAAMANLGYTGQSEIDCPSEWSIPGTSQVWQDWTVAEGLGPQGLLTLHNAIVASCNTVFYQLGAALDEQDDRYLPDMAEAFGLGKPTGIPYLYEIAGTVPNPDWKLEVVGDYWARGDAVNLAIGQGFLEATPLQMAVAYTAIANNGSVLQPYIVEYAQAPNKALERIGERKGRNRLPLERERLKEIQAALRDQTSNSWGAGSARVFGDFSYPIAGKTGTAQNELNRAGKPHSWFAAFGPYGEKATIASIVMIESVGEGVSFAAPATRAIYEAYLKTDLAEAG